MEYVFFREELKEVILSLLPKYYPEVIDLWIKNKLKCIVGMHLSRENSEESFVFINVKACLGLRKSLSEEGYLEDSLLEIILAETISHEVVHNALCKIDQRARKMWDNVYFVQQELLFGDD